MVNNYPPLSFYLVGALARLTGDAVIAGRILACCRSWRHAAASRWYCGEWTAAHRP